MSLVFLSHGGPGSILSGEDDKVIEFWEKEMPSILFGSKQTQSKPKAIIFLSAHWYKDTSKGILINSSNQIIHDFGEFFPGIYDIGYHTPVVPRGIMEEVKDALGGSSHCTEVGRGLDHGVWIPMKYIEPQGTIPIIQIALPTEPKDLIELGSKLAVLLSSSSDFSICCSGGTVHNLPHVMGRIMRSTGGRVGGKEKVSSDGVTVESWANEFETKIKDLLESGVTGAKAFLQTVLSWNSFLEAHPTPDHFFPLLVAVAIAEAVTSRSEPVKARKVYDEFLYGSLAMSVYEFH